MCVCRAANWNFFNRCVPELTSMRPAFIHSAQQQTTEITTMTTHPQQRQHRVSVLAHWHIRIDGEGWKTEEFNRSISGSNGYASMMLWVECLLSVAKPSTFTIIHMEAHANGKHSFSISYECKSITRHCRRMVPLGSWRLNLEKEQ